MRNERDRDDDRTRDDHLEKSRQDDTIDLSRPLGQQMEDKEKTKDLDKLAEG